MNTLSEEKKDDAAIPLYSSGVAAAAPSTSKPPPAAALKKPPPSSTSATTTEIATATTTTTTASKPSTTQEDLDRQLAFEIFAQEYQAQQHAKAAALAEMENIYRPVLELVWPEVYCYNYYQQAARQFDKETEEDDAKKPAAAAPVASANPAQSTTALPETNIDATDNDSNNNDDVDGGNNSSNNNETGENPRLTIEQTRQGLYEYGVVPFLDFLDQVAGIHDLDELAFFADDDDPNDWYNTWTSLSLWDCPQRTKAFHFIAKFIALFGGDVLVEQVNHAKQTGQSVGQMMQYIARHVMGHLVEQGEEDDEDDDEGDHGDPMPPEEDSKMPAHDGGEKSQEEEDSDLATAIALSMEASHQQTKSRNDSEQSLGESGHKRKAAALTKTSTEDDEQQNY